ncbi:Gfo/Idh/MocA family protein [Halomarina ordinaria]|uniref:Gfo/Idh/MocA family protein n=1 Tax=Halomarina ordinaria TaxID=3033939 RepID=A0ABD5U818_9EURY|nr:Gfo/Idh/MocA family oxidoreductase [Halomarina sp. PSRA2]
MSTGATSPLRIGLLGTGFIGTRVGDQLHGHPGATVTAVTDVDGAALSSAGDTFGVPGERRYTDYRTMFAEAPLDAVVVGTPHTLHYEQIVDALDADLHVLCDKPLTTDLGDALDVRDRVEASDRTLMVGYQRHLNPAFVAARERWAERDPRWLTAEVTQDWVDRFEGTWRLDPDLSGGGYLYDTGSHLLDALLWTTGLTPTAVSARMSFVDDERRVDERADLTIRFAEGATASVSTFGAAPCTREHIHGWDDDGALYLSGREWEPRDLLEIDAESGEHRPFVDHSAVRDKGEAFVAAVRGERPPPATVQDGVRVTAVTEAAYESAREDGAWVDVDADLAVGTRTGR